MLKTPRDTGQKKRSKTSESKTQARDDGISHRALNFIFRISESELALLSRYQETLALAAARFAESYYNYLFDNPSIARVLYDYEINGGDVSDLIRSHLQQLLSILDGAENEDNAELLRLIGQRHEAHGIEPMWVMGAFLLYLNHLRSLIRGAPEFPTQHRDALETALIKVIYRAVGIVLDSYWQTALERESAARLATQDQQEQIKTLVGNIPQALWSVDTVNNRVLYASPATRNFFPDSADDPIPCLRQVDAVDRERLQAVWGRALKGRQMETECQVDIGVGGRRWFKVHLYPFSEMGNVVRIDGLLEDITDSKETLSRLEDLATTDKLTGLANRAVWYDRLKQAMNASRRSGGHKVITLITNLDQFKQINESLGYPAGDEVLRQVAGRLGLALRTSDTLARMEADVFMVLLPVTEEPEQSGIQVAQKVMHCFDSPFNIAGQEIFLNAVSGISVFPDHGDMADILIRNAETATVQARQLDLPYQFFCPQGNTATNLKLQFSGQLRHALERDEFELYYQPKVDLRTGKVAGAEALLRWQHPQEGLLQPLRFLQIAERNGLISPITDWVLETALRQCQEWKICESTLAVSINLSPRSLQDPQLTAKIHAALVNAGVDGTHLEIEITEHTLMSDLDKGMQVLAQLADMGIGIAVDDFGTGYSSLSYLKRLPIHTLKIDKSFLADMTENENDAVIVRSIIDLGHNLGFKVIAEGVEDREAWDLLSILGCDEVQGFHISHPLPQEGFNRWLMAGN